VSDVIKSGENHVVRIQWTKRVKIGGCIDVWAFTIVEDTSEDSTVGFIMLKLGSQVTRGRLNTMGVVVL